MSDTNLTSLFSLDDMMAAMANIEGVRDTPAPTADDLYESSGGNSYTKWRMPTDTRTALVANKVDVSRGPSISLSKPGNYKETEKMYSVVNGTPTEVFPTTLVGVMINVEVRPSRQGNSGEGTASSVIGICRGNECIRRLPSNETGLFANVYEFNENKDSRNTAPSKQLTSLKWKPVTSEGVLLEDLIRDGKSTAMVLNKEGKEVVASYDNRGMAYMYLTHVGVSVKLASDAKGEPIIPKMMNKEEAMQNLVTTERRVDKKVFKSYSTLRLYPLNELMDEDGTPLDAMFVGLNMSNSAMKSAYNEGLAGVTHLLTALLNCQGLKAPLGRTLSEADGTILRTINDMEFYKRLSAWTTVMTLGMKKVQESTFYSVPHFEAFDVFGTSIYDGYQHKTWADARNGSSLNVTYYSDYLRERVKYNPATSVKVGLWDKSVLEAGFDAEPEKFLLSDLAPEVIPTPRKGYTDVSYRVAPAAEEYLVEADEDEGDLY